jgi:hypothetical protein
VGREGPTHSRCQANTDSHLGSLHFSGEMKQFAEVRVPISESDIEGSVEGHLGMPCLLHTGDSQVLPPQTHEDQGNAATEPNSLGCLSRKLSGRPWRACGMCVGGTSQEGW